jgi:hypothetical protein
MQNPGPHGAKLPEKRKQQSVEPERPRIYRIHPYRCCHCLYPHAPCYEHAASRSPENNPSHQQIRALEEKMTEEERGNYLDARDMGEDFCSAGY